MINTHILYIIISEFSYKKELSPMILFINNKSFKIDFYEIILLLSLAIAL